MFSTGTNIVKIWLSLWLVGCVRFARHCGTMYSHHLFSYGGFKLVLESKTFHKHWKVAQRLSLETGGFGGM